MKNIIPFLIIGCIAFTACQSGNVEEEQNEGNDKEPTESSEGENQGEYQPNASGKEFEVLVIGRGIQDQASLKEAIDSIFHVNYPGLPQPEFWFITSYLNYDNMQNMHKKHKSIFFISGTNDQSPLIDQFFNQQEIQKMYNKGKRGIITKKDLWAEPQLVTFLHASKKKQIVNYLYEKAEYIRDQFDHVETNYIWEKLYPGSQDRQKTARMKEELGFNFKVPVGYKEAKLIGTDEANSNKAEAGIQSLAWYRIDTKKSITNLMAYAAPYDKDGTPTKSYIKKVRDRVGKVFVDGPSEGSYMETEDRIDIQTRPTILNGHEAIQARGLWRIEGDYMGGPFINYAIHDQANDRVIFLEGFVYAAGTKKKPFIKRAETALGTFSMAEEPQS